MNKKLEALITKYEDILADHEEYLTGVEEQIYAGWESPELEEAQNYHGSYVTTTKEILEDLKSLREEEPKVHNLIWSSTPELKMIERKILSTTNVHERATLYAELFRELKKEPHSAQPAESQPEPSETESE